MNREEQSFARTADRLKETWPVAPDNPTDRLAHVLDVFAEWPDDMNVITATRGVYGPGTSTGLTLGDLRCIAVELGIH